jgi:hypothetical protein
MDVFAFIKRLIQGDDDDDDDDKVGEEMEMEKEFEFTRPNNPVQSVQSVVAVLIYPGGMTTTLCIPTQNAEEVVEFIHYQLGGVRLFHVGAKCEEGDFQGCEVWHNSALYEKKDYNRKASLYMKMPLYGKVVVVNGNVDPTKYDNLSTRLINHLKRSLPPVHTRQSSQQQSNLGKRNRYSFQQPISDDHIEQSHKDNKQPSLQPNKDNNNNENTFVKKKPKMIRPTRRSSRIAARHTK